MAEPGETAWIVESGLFLREVRVLKRAGGFAVLRFADTGGGVRLRETRLFSTREEAEARRKRQKQRR